MKRGFSLVELSIVLVILGLLTGGILAGQSLIRASELRAVTAEYQRYAASTQTFRDKYFAYPGDFRDATKFWSRQINAAHCPTNSGVATINASSGACDGDGDGLMDYAVAGTEAGEMFQFWRHLALAGLIEGSYTGLAGAGDFRQSDVGINIPKSKISTGGWGGVRYSGSFAGDANDFAIDVGNMFEYGGQTVWYPSGGILRPEEAWNIDTKMDDGKPASGKVIGRFWNNICSAADDGSSANNDLVASYRLTDTALRCALIFRHLF